MIRTYVFDDEQFEMSYGVCRPDNWYLLHFFDGEEYLGAIKYDGSFTRDFSTVKPVELEPRYWTLFE